MIAPPKNKFRNTPRPKVRENVNEGIRCPEVRAIFPDGTNEILQTRIAVQKAQALELDLVLVSPDAKPPVAKVIDHSKFLYEEKKRQKEAKRKQHVIQVKELKFRPNTDDHDYEFKKNHAIEFLNDGNKVKAVVAFRGREMAHTDLGMALLHRLLADLADTGKAEAPPRQDGKNAFVIISAAVKK